MSAQCFSSRIFYRSQSPENQFQIGLSQKIPNQKKRVYDFQGRELMNQRGFSNYLNSDIFGANRNTTKSRKFSDLTDCSSENSSRKTQSHVNHNNMVDESKYLNGVNIIQNNNKPIKSDFKIINYGPIQLSSGKKLVRKRDAVLACSKESQQFLKLLDLLVQQDRYHDCKKVDNQIKNFYPENEFQIQKSQKQSNLELEKKDKIVVQFKQQQNTKKKHSYVFASVVLSFILVLILIHTTL